MVAKFADDDFGDEEAEEQEVLSVYGLAREAMEHCGRDVGAAVAYMCGEVESDPDLMTRVVKPSLPLYFEMICVKVRAGHRSGVLHPPANPDKGREGLLRMAARQAESLLDFPLMDGTPLGDAEDVLIDRTADFYLKRGKTYTVNGRWLKEVLERKEPGRKPRQAFTDDALRSLRKQVEELSQ